MLYFFLTNIICGKPLICFSATTQLLGDIATRRKHCKSFLNFILLLHKKALASDLFASTLSPVILELLLSTSTFELS